MNNKELNNNETEKVTGGSGDTSSIKYDISRPWSVRPLMKYGAPRPRPVLEYGGPKPFDIKDLEKRIKRKSKEEPEIEELLKE